MTEKDGKSIFALELRREYRRQFKGIIHKKHFVEESNYRVYDYVYLCNQAVLLKPKKAHYHWKNVTCKNCLKHRK